MYDYIIIGAGSAGCVLANRLSAHPDVRVLLLEAGPRDWHPFIHMPAGVAKLVNRKGVNWDYSTEPEPELDGREPWWPRGKVLGGSSSINASNAPRIKCWSSASITRIMEPRPEPGPRRAGRTSRGPHGPSPPSPRTRPRGR